MVRTRSQQSAPSGESLNFKVKKSTTIETTIENGMDISIVKTIEKETLVFGGLDNSTDDDEYIPGKLPSKVRTSSWESNPAASTRSQQKALRELLSEEDVPTKTDHADDASSIASDGSWVKIEAEDDTQTATSKKSTKSKLPLRLRKKTTKNTKQAGDLDRFARKMKIVKLKINLNALKQHTPELDQWASDLPVVSVSIPTPTSATTKKMPASYWDNRDYKVKFGETPHKTFGPSHAQAYEVFYILSKSLREKGIFVDCDGVVKGGAVGPTHGADTRSVDILVRTIMAQGTNNTIALASQQEMREYFTYTVDGEEVVGKIPNYHRMLQCPQQELFDVIKHAGFGGKRSIYIKSALQTVYDKNLAIIRSKNGGELPVGLELGQPLNVGHFVPGLLSLDFVTEMSKTEAFNFLADMIGIGVKTSICILEFNFGFPLCAVDTHIMKMATWLKHIPESVKTETACFNHLDAMYPDDIKHALHQVFWHHAQVCRRCKRKAAKDDIKEDEEVCPIEHLLERKGGKHSRTTRKFPSTSPKPRVASAKVEKKYKALSAFKTEAAAKAAGYALWEYAMDDDFASGSVNTTMRKLYRKVKAMDQAAVKVEAMEGTSV